MLQTISLLTRLAVLTLLWAPPVFAQILHLELGAANYAAVDLSREEENRRFEALRLTVRQLASEYGATGTIYLNDKDETGLAFAANHLRAWLRDLRWNSIKVVTLPGNYNSIELPEVKTLSMNNPDRTQVLWQNDRGVYGSDPSLVPLPGQTLTTTRDYNDEIARQLLRLAARSATGLRINTYYQEAMERLSERLVPGSLEVLPEPAVRYYDAHGEAYGHEVKTMVYRLAQAARIIPPPSTNPCIVFLDRFRKR